MSEASGEAKQVEFLIQKIYVEDFSFESPQSPLVFREEWKPEANIDLNTESEKLEDNVYKVSLTVTVTTKNTDKTAFLVEVKQTGIFTIMGMEEADMAHLLGSFCPNTLFPYARETICSAVTRGGFPELSIAPINFDALYQQSQAEAANDTKDK